MADPTQTTQEEPATPSPEAIETGAAESTAAGISSYTHRDRSVTRISPMVQLDVADRLRANAHRRAHGPFMRVSQGGGR